MLDRDRRSVNCSRSSPRNRPPRRALVRNAYGVAPTRSSTVWRSVLKVERGPASQTRGRSIERGRRWSVPPAPPDVRRGDRSLTRPARGPSLEHLASSRRPSRSWARRPPRRRLRGANRAPIARHRANRTPASRPRSMAKRPPAMLMGPLLIVYDRKPGICLASGRASPIAIVRTPWDRPGHDRAPRVEPASFTSLRAVPNGRARQCADQPPSIEMGRR